MSRIKLSSFYKTITNYSCLTQYYKLITPLNEELCYNHIITKYEYIQPFSALFSKKKIHSHFRSMENQECLVEHRSAITFLVLGNRTGLRAFPTLCLGKSLKSDFTTVLEKFGVFRQML